MQYINIKTLECQDAMVTQSIFSCLAIGLYSRVSVDRKSNIRTINRGNDFPCDKNGIC